MVSLWQRLHFASWTALVLLLGFALGTFALELEEAASPAPITPLRRDIQRRAPIVHIQEINNGEIVGIVGTGARLVIGDDVVVPRPDRTFSLDAKPFLVNVIDVPVPFGSLFVASKRGKNYYKVDSSAGQKLSPENRLYFKTEEAAKAAGYKKGF